MISQFLFWDFIGFVREMEDRQRNLYTGRMFLCYRKQVSK